MLVLFLVLLLLLGLFIAALALPVRVWVTIHNTEEMQLTATVRPFGGLGPQISLAGGHKKYRKTPVRKRKKIKRKRPKLGSARMIIPEIPNLISGLLHSIHFEQIQIDGEFGLDDPSDTGTVYGLWTPLIYGSPGLPHCAVSVRPVFGRACLSGDAVLQLWITPTSVVLSVLRFGWRVFGPLR